MPFLLTVVILGAAVGARSFLHGVLAAQQKLPIPLRQPLAKLDKKLLKPYEFLGRATLSAAVIESLGTDQYINWGLRDAKVKRRADPLRRVNLHVAYYSGGRDLVPHTPDQCMRGAGYEPTRAENIDVYIPSLDRSIPLRVLTFEKSSILRNEKPTVCYTFHANGDFTCTRNGVRRRINSLGSRHAYFCKIEVSFGSSGSKPANPSREDSIKAATEFLNRFLPVLLDNHLPEWKEVLAEEAAAKAASESG